MSGRLANGRLLDGRFVHAQKQRPRPQPQQQQGGNPAAPSAKMDPPRSARTRGIQAPCPPLRKPAASCSPIQLAQGVDGHQLAGGVVSRGSHTPCRTGESPRTVTELGVFIQKQGAGALATVLTFDCRQVPA